ncbi:MAG: aspartate--tRNA ligase [Acidimicrobiia bacterium]|nr:aspartate--tRNA ligase [Acidimicrobiia bacterium]
MMRTHYAGEIDPAQCGDTVVVCGWVASRRDHGGVVFLDIRDVAGIVQVVIDPDATTGADPHGIRAEYVLRVEGVVRDRPDGTVNAELPTGAVEIAATAVEVLNAADPAPIPIDDRTEADEMLRLKYRYLDLRSGRLQSNLRLRAKLNTALRDALGSRGFLEVETPMLIASTPEGARDFVVPSRLAPGRCYALPQSPQLFKQLLMVGGIDRYYQIARCLRDEDPRADRQFEFTQLDAEMSFADAEDVMSVIGEVVGAAIEAVTGDAAPMIERLSWHEAMARFGSDKPDLRFGLELVDATEVFAATEFRAFQGAAVKALRVPGQGDLGRSRLDGLIERAKQLGAPGLVWMRVQQGGMLEAPVAKFLSEGEQVGLVDVTGATPGDLLLLAAGPRRMADHVLGAIRLDLGRPPVGEGGRRLAWIVDFPLFESIDDDGRPIPAHHPFTMPHPDDLELLEHGSGAELLDVRSLAYDLVLNGWELGSGSVRIHTAEVQARIFSVLGIEPEVARARFGFLLDAFRYGAPPHAGFAFGVDRLVALLAGEENIREVIAFPKTQSGADPLTGAPTPIEPAQLRELGLSITKSKQSGQSGRSGPLP